MKWDKRGQQFDELGEVLYRHKGDIYIYGAGEYGEDLLKRISFLDANIFFVDNSPIKQKQGYKDRKVKSPSELLELKEEHIVIVAASIRNTEIILKHLLCKGYVENENLFTYKRFIEFYLPVYATYLEEKSYIQDITILVTEKCTLKCAKCAPMYPYLKDPQNRQLKDIILDIDELFSHVDFVWDLIFTGGEPFLHNNFYEILDYVNRYYENRFGQVQIITNGTIIPSHKMLELMKCMKLSVTLSDYTKTISKLIDKYKEFSNALDLYTVPCVELKVEQWVDFGFGENEISEETSERMIDLFDRCNSSCRAFSNRYFIYCVPAYYSQIALEGSITDHMNFFVPNNKKELLEYNMGYSENGYLNMCRKCNGYITINHNYVQVAEQLVK